MGGRRRGHAAPGRGLAAADVRPGLGAGEGLSTPREVSVSPDWHEVADLLPDAGPGRFLLGISGAPGAGKSTLATHLATAYGAAHVPMDGFHLADVELERRGLRMSKGAPETFDAWGYAALLARLRERPDHDVLAPAFERHPSTGSGQASEQPLAGAIAVPPEAGLVVTEGNYLLLDTPEWRAVRAQLDAVWHLRPDPAVRRERLLARHVAFGKSPDEARAWVERVDDPNAALVEAAADRADLLLTLTRRS